MKSISSQKPLAKELGFSVGKINYVIKVLIDKGLIKAENFVSCSKNKKYSYLLTDKSIKEKIALTKKLIERKRAEYEEL